MWTKVDSSVIDSVAYYEDESILEIQFLSGNTYIYFEVEQNIFDDFLASDSKGRFYNNQIKGFYDSAKK